MPEEPGGLVSAHRTLLGASAVAVVLAIVGSTGAVIEILSASAHLVRWAAGGVLTLVALCWLVAVIRRSSRNRSDPPPAVRTARSDSRLGYTSLLLLVAGCGLLGWNTNAALAGGTPPTPCPADECSSPSPPPSPVTGRARITSPGDGDDVARCTVPVRIDGAAAPGKVLLTVTKQQGADHYFESLVEPAGTDRWSASVQVGQARLSSDERYTVAVYELDRDLVGYLVAVFRKGREAAGSADSGATYWNTAGRPPGMGEPLHSIDIHRTKDDPDCPG